MCREQVNQLLEASNWAPTHGKTEPWRYVVIGREHMQEMLDLTIRVGLTNGFAGTMSTPQQGAAFMLSAGAFLSLGQARRCHPVSLGLGQAYLEPPRLAQPDAEMGMQLLCGVMRALQGMCEL